MEDTLIVSLLESVRAGLRADSSFKKSAWVSTRAAVQAVSSTPVTIRHYTTKYDTLKKDWKQWNALVSQSGFTFDETGRVMGDEGALDEYFKRYPLAAKLRLQPLRAADSPPVVQWLYSNGQLRRDTRRTGSRAGSSGVGG